MIRIATFNVLFGHRETGPNSWSERRPLLRRAIEAARADVLGLQEVLPSKLGDVADLVAPLAIVPGPCTGPPRWFDASSALDSMVRTLRTPSAFRGQEARARSERMQAGEHQPIAYRAERVELLDTGGFWISEDPGRPGSMLRHALSPILVHWARLAARDGSGPLLVMNAHFGHAPWHHAATARIVTAQLGALQGGGAGRRGTHGSTPSEFLVGDFNALPSSLLLRLLTAASGPGFVNAARSAAARTGPPVSFHWGTGATRLGLTLDYVLARTPLEPRRAEVIDVREGRLHPSDHHPLVVEFGPGSGAVET